MEKAKSRMAEAVKYLKFLLYPALLAGVIGLAFLTNGALTDLAIARTPVPSSTPTSTPVGGMCTTTGLDYVLSYNVNTGMPDYSPQVVTKHVRCSSLTATPTSTPRGPGK